MIQLDYTGRPTFTGRSSPVLIPVVPSLAAPYAYDNIYYTCVSLLVPAHLTQIAHILTENGEEKIQKPFQGALGDVIGVPEQVSVD